MPVVNDAPTGIGAQDGWPMYPSGAKPTKMAAVETNDADLSVLYGVSSGAVVRQLFTFPTLAGVADPVNALSLTAIARMYSPGSGARVVNLEINSTAGATNFSATLLGAAPNYRTCTQAAAGLALATANGEHGIRMSATGGMEIWCTQLYRTTDYTELPPGSSSIDFVFIVGALGPWIGVGLLLREMPRMARALSRVWRGGRNFRLRADELEPAWRAWRSFRHPVFVDLGGAHCR